MVLVSALTGSRHVQHCRPMSQQWSLCLRSGPRQSLVNYSPSGIQWPMQYGDVTETRRRRWNFNVAKQTGVYCGKAPNHFLSTDNRTSNTLVLLLLLKRLFWKVHSRYSGLESRWCVIPILCLRQCNIMSFIISTVPICFTDRNTRTVKKKKKKKKTEENNVQFIVHSHHPSFNVK